MARYTRDELAQSLIDLINSKPRSPTKRELVDWSQVYVSVLATKEEEDEEEDEEDYPPRTKFPVVPVRRP